VKFKVPLIKNRVLNHKIPISLALIIVATFSALGYIVVHAMDKPKIISETNVSNEPCKDYMRIIHNNEYRYTQPMLTAEMPLQSSLLLPLKRQIENVIQEVKKVGVKDFSVYLLRLNSGDWIGIDNEKEYNSSGYIRLAILITYLKMAETNPAILQKKLLFEPPVNIFEKGQTELPIKNYYSVNELLKIMMANEDTTAKYALTVNISQEELAKFYKVLNLNVPDFNKRKFAVTVADYSKFLEVLYNANYLNIDQSEYALSLLYNASGKKNGILELLPEGAKAIHKYTNRFNNNQFELRESGIIYSDQDTYQITIFATGAKQSILNSASAKIGKIVFDWSENL
jgi:hypothetical protein